MYVVIDCYEGEAEIVGRAETVEQAKQIEHVIKIMKGC